MYLLNLGRSLTTFAWLPFGSVSFRGLGFSGFSGFFLDRRAACRAPFYSPVVGAHAPLGVLTDDGQRNTGERWDVCDVQSASAQTDGKGI